MLFQLDGGWLALRSLPLLSKALLEKCSQKFSCEQGSLWTRIMEGGWGDFQVKTSISIANGQLTKFWIDEWCWETKLKDCILTLFAITIHRDAWVVYYWDDGKGTKPG